MRPHVGTGGTVLSLPLYVNGGEGVTALQIDSAGEMTSTTGRVAALVVAANDASARSKAQADYVCDGVDDQVQLQAAHDALPAVGGRIVLTEGTFTFSAVLTVTKNSTTIQGQGSGATTIRSAAANTGIILIQLGLGVVTLADCNIYDILFDAAVQKTANPAIDLNLCFKTRIQRIRMYHQYRCIHVHNSTETWISDSDFRDTKNNGVEFDSDLAAGFDLYINNVCADNPVVANTGAGLQWTGGENVVVVNCDFIHFNYGLEVLPGAGRQCRWAFFLGAEFDTSGDNCWALVNNPGDIAGLTFVNCWAGTATNYGVLIDGSHAGKMDGISLVGCKIHHCGLAGIRFVAGAKQVKITDCDIFSNSQTVGGVRSGIEITAGATEFVISDNHISNDQTQGNTQANGINFDAGATDYFVIANNDVRGNTNTGILNLGGVTGTHGQVHHNVGYNPVGVLGPPGVPGTGVVFPNPYNLDCTVYITGGAGVAVAIGGSATGLAAGTFRVAAGQSITLTYGGAPAWVWMGD